MYFLVENRAKMGAGRLKYKKYSFWSQNDIVLAFLGLKRHRFSHQNFFKFKTLSKQCRFGLSRTKTTSFWSVQNQNDVVLVLFSLMQNDVVFARTALNDVVLICIKKKKLNDIVLCHTETKQCRLELGC